MKANPQHPRKQSRSADRSVAKTKQPVVLAETTTQRSRHTVSPAQRGRPKAPDSLLTQSGKRSRLKKSLHQLSFEEICALAETSGRLTKQIRPMAVGTSRRIPPGKPAAEAIYKAAQVVAMELVHALAESHRDQGNLLPFVLSKLIVQLDVARLAEIISKAKDPNLAILTLRYQLLLERENRRASHNASRTSQSATAPRERKRRAASIL